MPVVSQAGRAKVLMYRINTQKFFNELAIVLLGRLKQDDELNLGG